MHPNDLCRKFVSLKKYSNIKHWMEGIERGKANNDNEWEKKNELDQKEKNAGKIIEIQFHGSKII